jgi:HNH endonuclease
LVREVAGVVARMPLWKLQRAGNQTLDFLYPNVGRGSSITLRPGVAYCLRSFYKLLTDLIRGAWVRYVRRFNAALIGAQAELSEFLFGSERANLAPYLPILARIQVGRCFYCREPLSRQLAIDHFVPWTRYPTDLGHNFVLAHARCNGNKADFLAAEPHIEAWVERNRRYGDDLAEQFARARLPYDLGASLHVARWAYAQAERAGGLCWVEARTTRSLSHDWAAILGR